MASGWWFVVFGIGNTDPDPGSRKKGENVKSGKNSFQATRSLSQLKDMFRFLAASSRIRNLDQILGRISSTKDSFSLKTNGLPYLLVRDVAQFFDLQARRRFESQHHADYFCT